MQGKTLEMTRLGQHLKKINASIDMWKVASSNFANIANQTLSFIYCIQNSAGVGLKSIWATIEYPILSTNSIIYGIVNQNGTIQMMP